MDIDVEHSDTRTLPGSASGDSPADDLSSVLESEINDDGRQKLMNEIADIMLAVPFDHIRALLWLADKECLSEIIEESNKGRSQARSQRPSKTSGMTTPDKRLNDKKGSLETPDIPKELCLERDHKRCVITNCNSNPEVARLYPASMTGMRPTGHYNNLWTLLRLFWSEERVKKWEEAVFPCHSAHADTCSNMMCLDKGAHHYLDQGDFAMKPISLSEDQRSLELQFFWLKRGEWNQESIAVRPSLRTDSDAGPGEDRLYFYENSRNSEPGRLIHSGEKFTMTTNDPVKRPLPNYSILEMNWFLQRASAIAGAADTEEFDDDDDNSEEEEDFEICSLEIPADTTSDDKAAMNDSSFHI